MGHHRNRQQHSIPRPGHAGFGIRVGWSELKTKTPRHSSVLYVTVVSLKINLVKGEEPRMTVWLPCRRGTPVMPLLVRRLVNGMCPKFLACPRLPSPTWNALALCRLIPQLIFFMCFTYTPFCFHIMNLRRRSLRRSMNPVFVSLHELCFNIKK